MNKDLKNKIIREFLFWTLSFGILFCFLYFISDGIRDRAMEGLGYFSFGYIVGKIIQYILKKLCNTKS